MGLFSTPSRRVVLLDIGSASVGGGFLYNKKGELPVLCYTARRSIEPRKGESITDAMARTLELLGEQLIYEGSAALHRESGSSHIDLVLASVAGPWQDTKVRMVSLQEEYPFTFTFTRKIMERAVRTEIPGPGRTLSDTSVISTSLNGYETEHPWGKRAHRADMTVLTSTIDSVAVNHISRVLRKLFHSHPLEITAFAPLAYAVVQDLYPLQKDYIVLDVGGTSTDAIIVKKGVLAGIGSLPKGVHDLLQAGKEAAHGAGGVSGTNHTRNATFATTVAAAETLWLAELRKMLAQFASEHPLPRAVFLLADESSREFLKQLIDSSTIRTLWLTEEPLSLIPLAPEHTSSVVKARGLAEGDIFLSMLALFYQDRLAKF